MKIFSTLSFIVLLATSVLFIPPTFAQDNPSPPTRLNVKGKVIDELGTPVIATISVKGSKLATSTNAEGEFEIKDIDSNAVLIISGVSIETQEISIQGKKDIGTITVSLKFKESSEVVVEANTGYQRLKPNEINGSVIVIDNKTLNQQVGTNILRRLDGVTSGLAFTNKTSANPESNLNLAVRGLSTIHGPLNPLIVMDNFIYEGDISNINPNDVESITILKDAAATSIYGAKGGNGVIVITTKKGKANQGLKIDFNSTLIIQEKHDLFSLPQISSEDYLFVEQFLFNNGYYNDLISSNSINRLPITPGINIFLNRRNGLISQVDSANQINSLKQNDIRNDYTRYLYTNAATQQYSLSLRGNSNTNSYTLSINHDRNRNALYENFNKLNISIQNTYQPIKQLQFIVGAYYTNSINQSGRTRNVLFGGKSVPYLELETGQGESASIPQAYSENYTDTIGGGMLLNWRYYPLEDYKHDRTRASLEEIVANLGVIYIINSNLNVDIRYQYQRQNENFERYADIESYYTRNLINQFTQIDYSTGELRYLIPNNGILTRATNTLNSQNFRSQLNFKKAWGDHLINSILGFEVREIARKGFTNTIYGYNPDPLSYSDVDYANQYPILPYGDENSIPGSPYTSATLNRFLSQYANISYLYKNKYSLSGSIRRDGANIFGVNTNDKWKPLWSAGIGWEITKESFFKVRPINYLRLRATYGYSGNVDVSRSALPIANYYTNSTTNIPYTRILTLNNPELRWEQSQQTNFALDFSFFNNRIQGAADFYIKRGKDLYGFTTYDYTTWGFQNQITKNVASSLGKGLDIRIATKNIDRIIKWGTEILFNYNTTKVTEYFTTQAELGSQLVGSVGMNISPVIGKPLYALVAYKWAGLNDQGDPQGYFNGQKSTDYRSIISAVSSNGIKNNESVKYIGSAAPTVFGSFINSFSYNRLSLAFNLSYKFGYYFKKTPMSYASLFSQGTATDDFSKRWQKPGDENNTDIPALVYTNYPQFSFRETFYNAAEIHYLKGDHIRLQYINLMYSIKEVGKKNKIGIKVYANLANLGVVWRANNAGLDPDFPNSLVTPKTYAIGLQASF